MLAFVPFDMPPALHDGLEAALKPKYEQTGQVCPECGGPIVRKIGNPRVVACAWCWQDYDQNLNPRNMNVDHQ